MLVSFCLDIFLRYQYFVLANGRVIDNLYSADAFHTRTGEWVSANNISTLMTIL